MDDGRMQEPILGKGDFVPHDWQERREWERTSLFRRIHNRMKKKVSTKQVDPQKIQAGVEKQKGPLEVKRGMVKSGQPKGGEIERDTGPIQPSETKVDGKGNQEEEVTTTLDGFWD